MAWLSGEKKFGQYTYEHWYDDEEHIVLKNGAEGIKAKTTGDPCNTTPDKPSQQPEPSCHNPCSQDS